MSSVFWFHPECSWEFPLTELIPQVGTSGQDFTNSNPGRWVTLLLLNGVVEAQRGQGTRPRPLDRQIVGLASSPGLTPETAWSLIPAAWHQATNHLRGFHGLGMGINFCYLSPFPREGRMLRDISNSKSLDHSGPRGYNLRCRWMATPKDTSRSRTPATRSPRVTGPQDGPGKDTLTEHLRRAHKNTKREKSTRNPTSQGMPLFFFFFCIFFSSFFLGTWNTLR